MGKWTKGAGSPNPGGRPKMTQAMRSIRAQARVDSQRAYNALLRGLDDPDKFASCAVKILQLAGVSFASDAEETKAQAEASKATALPTADLEAAAEAPMAPLN